MKKGILRVLGVFVSLALMLTALPASMVMAAATVTNLVVTNTEGTASTNPYYGKAEGLKNDDISLTLTGTTSTYYSLYFSSQQASKGDDIGDEVKTYKEWESLFYTAPATSSYIPVLNLPSSLLDGTVDESELHGGVYYFYVTQYHPGTDTTAAYSDTDILFVAEYYIHGIAEASISDTQGMVGDPIQITGEGFAPEEYIVLKYDNVEINDYIAEGDDQVDEDGTFSFTFTVPPSIKGTHTIKVIGGNSRVEEEFTFTVSPSITLSATSGAAGSTITVYGEGFNRSKYVDIYFGSTKIDDNNAAVRTDRTNSAGSITYLLTVPATAAAGTYTITIEDESNDNITASANFTVALNSVITLSKNTGNVGDTVTAAGTNFSPSTTLTILFDNITVGTATTDASGNFTQQITIPAAVSGAHAIKVGAVQQTFTVTPKMVLDKTQGIAGTTVTITGTGFPGGTSIVATFSNTPLTLNPSVTDASGGFTAIFTVPMVAAGTYEVRVIAGSTQTANFTVVDPTISLDKNSGKVGESITITGTNFAAGSTITFTIDGAANPNLPTATAGANGGFTVSFNIPAIAGGAHTLAVTSGVISKSAQFTVNANASIAPVSGNVGTSVTVTGTGFTASTAVTIKYNGSVVASGTLTTPNGSFSATFPVPASPGGIRTVEVSDGTNTISSLLFAMEEVAPPSPTLTLPENASKQKEIITFDWSDVTDASLPVTYALQIATDSGFTNIVLNVASLTASTYTLTEGQELAKLADDGSYYWRVKATDAAGNSSYSNTSTFTVGGSMPGWLMWVWIGIGVVVVFIFAIWLGRRLAYSSY